jgi:hypothetical protein
MKSHYTILSAVIRPEIQEKISIGLLLVSANGLFFMCSKNKLSIVRSLIDSSLYKYLNETIRQIDAAISSETAEKGSIFVGAPHSIQYSEGYISYMNRYSNNLINFSEPIQIDMPSDNGLFQFLYNKYVDATAVTVRKAKSIDLLKADFFPLITTYYNTEKDITTNDIPGLPMSVNVDIIGKNEVMTFAQIIDFERNLNLIQQDVAVLEFLINALSNEKPKSFMVANEPDKTVFPKSHTVWNDLRQWNKVEFVPLDEIDRIRTYAQEHNVQPLLND